MVTQTRNPTSDVTVTGTWSGTAGVRYQSVDDHPDTTPADVITLSTAGGGNIRFGFSAFTVTTGSTALSFRVVACAQRNAGGAATFAARLAFNNGNIRDGTAATPSNGSISTHTFSWGSGNPSSGAAWTVDEINGIGPHGLASFGVVSTDASPSISLSSIRAEVDYTLPAVTGTIASTLDGVSSNLQGVVRNTGTISSTLAGVNAAFTGSLHFTGTFASTLAGVTANFQGVTTTPIPGFFSFLWLEGGGAGLIPTQTGTFASTLQGVTAAFSGAVFNPGSFSSTLGGVSMQFSGMAASQAGFTSLLWLEGGGASILPPPPTGTIEATLGGVSCSFAGVATNTGAFSATLAGVTANFGGFHGISFAGFTSLLWLEGGGASAVAISPYRLQPYDDGIPRAYYADPGYAQYYTYNPDGIAVGTRDSIGNVSGELASTLGGVTAAFSGLVTEEATGEFASTLANVTANIAGSVGAPEGSFESTLAGVFCDIVGSVTAAGPIDVTFAGVTMNASGQILVPGLFASTLEDVSASFLGGANPHVTGEFHATLQGVLGEGDSGIGSGFMRHRWLAIRLGLGL